MSSINSRTVVRKHQRKSTHRLAKTKNSNRYKRDRCKRKGSTRTRKMSIRKKSRIQTRTQRRKHRHCFSQRKKLGGTVAAGNRIRLKTGGLEGTVLTKSGRHVRVQLVGIDKPTWKKVDDVELLDESTPQTHISAEEDPEDQEAARKEAEEQARMAAEKKQVFSEPTSHTSTKAETPLPMQTDEAGSVSAPMVLEAEQVEVAESAHEPGPAPALHGAQPVSKSAERSATESGEEAGSRPEVTLDEGAGAEVLGSKYQAAEEQVLVDADQEAAREAEGQEADIAASQPPAQPTPRLFVSQPLAPQNRTRTPGRASTNSPRLRRSQVTSAHLARSGSWAKS